MLADSVAWISGRTSMVSALGGTAALLAAAAAPGWIGVAAGVALALLAGLLGKEDAVVFLPAALLIGWSRSPRRVLAVACGGALAVGAALALRGQALGSMLPSAPTRPWRGWPWASAWSSPGARCSRACG